MSVGFGFVRSARIVEILGKDLSTEQGYEAAIRCALSIIAQAKKLTKSEISKPFKLNDKWVVIKLTDKRQAEVASFVDAKEALSVNLARKAIQDFIGSSIKESEISILIR